MHIVPVYAAVLVLGFVWLSIRVIGLRRATKTGLGDGNDIFLRRACRAHANFAEYVPLALILLGMAEVAQAPVSLLHVLGFSLIAGRAIHAVAVSHEPELPVGRVVGMAATFTVLILAALINLWIATIA